MSRTETDHDEQMQDNPYEECSYCGKNIFPGSTQCPYCRNFTDGKGPFAEMRAGTAEKPRLKTIYVIAAWILVVLLLASEFVFAFFRG